MTLTVNAFSANKAGMTGLDKEKIQKIISSNTSSNFQEYSSKQIHRIEARIKRNNELLSRLSQEEIAKAESEMNLEAAHIEAERELTRVKVHIDMDAFFASVEMRDDPTLRSIPMGVGTDLMLGTSNYIARKFGVRAAMPGFMARKLCPELTIIKGDYLKYRKESSIIRKVFDEYDPNLESGGLDEVYMDITDYVAARKDPVSRKRIRYRGDCVCRLPLLSENDAINIVNEIRFRVEQISGLTCSAGIASNWMLAKICSDINKPNGQFRLADDKETIIEFMRTLPIRKVSGIGAVTEAILKGIGVEKCGDLFEKRGIIKLLFTELSWHWFLRVALGVSQRGASEETDNCLRHRKSISTERTFKPTIQLETLLDTIHFLCADLIESLAEGNILGGHVATLSIKFANFDRISRSQSANYRIDTVDNFYPMMERLLRKEMKRGLKIRLLGVRLSKLEFLEKETDATKRKSQKSLHEFLVPKKRLSASTTNEDSDDLFSDQFTIPPSEADSTEIPSTSSRSTIQCPICNQNFVYDENGKINSHIDECLNLEIINKMEETPSEAAIRPIKQAKSSSKSSTERYKAFNELLYC
uniref:DNA polymerase kappa n=1 Tax=Acrobeloides nanus TaxID=290746 RepID=A0A914CV45_9BILA